MAGDMHHLVLYAWQITHKSQEKWLNFFGVFVKLSAHIERSTVSCMQDVHNFCVCVSVCAKAETLLPGGLGTTGVINCISLILAHLKYFFLFLHFWWFVTIWHVLKFHQFFLCKFWGIFLSVLVLVLQSAHVESFSAVSPVCKISLWS